MLRLQNFLKCFLIKSQTFMKDTPVITTPPVAFEFWESIIQTLRAPLPCIYMCVSHTHIYRCVCVCDNLIFGWKIYGVELYIISAVHVYQSFNISSCSYQIVPMSYIYTCASSLVILAMSISHLVLLNRIIPLINLLKGEYF